MKTKILIIFSLIACFSIAQTPAPTGTWYKNATQKEKSQIKGVATLDANNVLDGYFPIDSIGGNVDLSNYYTKPETQSLISSLIAKDLINYPTKTEVSNEISDSISGLKSSLLIEKFIFQNSSNATKQFTLSQTPTQVERVTVTNSDIFEDNSEFSITGNTLRILSDLENNSVVRIWYWHGNTNSTSYSKSEADGIFYTKTQGQELEEIVNGIATGTGGKAYPDLTSAMAVLPIPSNGVVFTIDESNETEKGVYAYDSTQSGGYRFVSDLSVSQENLQNQANNLFKDSTKHLFPQANLTVRRYTANTTYNDYSAGYSQTAISDGLSVAIPQSGSAAISHYVRTGVSGSEKINLEINITNLTASSNAIIGIGYINGSGDYISYGINLNGVLRRVVNYSQVDIITTNLLVQTGDKLNYIVENGYLTIIRNDNQKENVQIKLQDGEFEGQLLVGQKGFPTYNFNLEVTDSDAIVNYVEDYVDNLPAIYYSYDPTALGNPDGQPRTGLFMIYQKLEGNKYIGYRLGHQYDMREAVYVDIWRIFDAKIYNYNNGVMSDAGLIALTSGENESVYKRNASKDDFTGGVHGDELMTEVLFFANGVQITNLTENIDLTPAQDFYYLQKSTMHATSESGTIITGHPLEAYHIKKTDFVDKGYETLNRLTWVMPGTISLWYSGIVCLGQDIGVNFYSDNYVQVLDGDFPETKSFENVFYRNNANGYSASINSHLTKIIRSGVDNTELENKEAILFVQDRTIDNKYYRKTRPLAVADGDVWESLTTVTFDTKTK